MSLASIVSTIDQTICGHSLVIPVTPESPMWLVLANAALLAVVCTVTLGSIIAALFMLIRPGERNPQHPKYRILNADR